MTFGQSAQAPDTTKTSKAAISQDFMGASPRKNSFSTSMPNRNVAAGHRIGKVLPDHTFRSAVTSRPAAIIRLSSRGDWSIKYAARLRGILHARQCYNVIVYASTTVHATARNFAHGNQRFLDTFPGLVALATRCYA